MKICLFCHTPGGEIIWQDDLCRVIFAPEQDYPGFCRVIVNQHVKEMTDLVDSAQLHLMRIVLQAEKVMRITLRPDKINLASLGNQTPHLHWHIIPRYNNDPHFPDAIWATAQAGQSPHAQSAECLQHFAHGLQQALSAMAPYTITDI